MAGVAAMEREEIATPPLVWPGERGWEQFAEAARLHHFLWAQLIDNFALKSPEDRHVLAAIAAGIEWEELEDAGDTLEIVGPESCLSRDSAVAIGNDGERAKEASEGKNRAKKMLRRGCSRFVHTVCRHCRRVEHLAIAERVLRLASVEDFLSVDENQATVLHAAVPTSPDLVELIVELAPPSLLTRQDSDGRTPLIIATARRKLATAMRVLLDAMDGDALSILSDVGMSALHQAVCSDPTPFVRAILDKMTDEQATQKTGSGMTSLHLAALVATAETVELLLQRFDQEAILALSPHNETALHLAARRGDVEVVALIAGAMSQADRCIRDANGDTALDIAGSNDNDTLVALLSPSPKGAMY